VCEADLELAAFVFRTHSSSNPASRFTSLYAVKTGFCENNECIGENSVRPVFFAKLKTIENAPCFHEKSGTFQRKSLFFTENRFFFRFSA